jgi:hypothetical protein
MVAQSANLANQEIGVPRIFHPEHGVPGSPPAFPDGLLDTKQAG